MGKNVISTLKEYFKMRGGLHDARITGISWDRNDGTLSMKIDDLDSNNMGFPEYKGPKPGEIVCTSVRAMDCNIQFDTGNLNIYEMDVEQHAKNCSVTIECSPGGYIKIECETIEVIEY